MLAECLEALQIKPEGTYVDVTFGGGGHSREILKRLGPAGRLLAFDRDEDAGRNVLTDERLVFIRHNYRFLYQFLRYYEALPVDGILADLGISSHQIDEPERGFSIRYDAHLDMRMSQQDGLTAADILNSYPEQDLVRIFSEYGEVFNAKTLARKICAARETEEIGSSGRFMEMIASCVDKQHESQYHAKVFQALRIEVNQELVAVQRMLEQSADVLKNGGRLVVMTYHSLEDRLVKNFIAKGRFEGEPEKDVFGNVADLPFRPVNKKPILAGDEEVKRNPRARSAKLRIAERN